MTIRYFQNASYAKVPKVWSAKSDSEAVILSKAKNLFFVGQILRLRLRMTRKCHFSHFSSL